MYLNKLKKPNGDFYLSIREKYHVPKVGSREKTIESIGYLSELKKTIEDPITFYTNYAKELTEKKKLESSKVININTNEVLSIGTNDTRNVGYAVLKILYKELEIDKFWNWKTKNRKMEFSTDKIFRLLTFSRAINPGSKRFTLNNKDLFFEPYDDISLDDIYYALNVIAEHKEDLQEWIYTHSKKIIDRDVSTGYFDCTNYYYDICRPDVDMLNEDGLPVDKYGNEIPAKYRKRGPEKNHRPDPIVQMGLLMDNNAIPIAFDLFPGNESEKVHMRPIIEKFKNNFEDSRVIFVADRGLNTSDNIYWINGDNKGEINERDGYVYGQSIRGADAEFKAWVLSGGYKVDKVYSDGKEVAFKHKSRIYPKTINVNVTTPGKKSKTKKKVQIDQKQMVYYSEKYAMKQRKDRLVMIERAKDLIKFPQKYDRVTAKGSASYVNGISYNKDTGEIADGHKLSLNIEKIKEEEKYDGYYSIVTSELNMADEKMREVYRGLAKIEDSFKVTKSFLQSRPIYVWLNEHIDAHFTTCFLSLVLIRILENKLDNKYIAADIIKSLKNYNCTNIDTNNWQFTYYDEILEKCAIKFGITLNKKYSTQQEIQRLLRY